MTPITAIVAEDEEPQRAALIQMLDELWPELSVVAECADGLSALEALHAHRPQLALLDIRMPGISGIAVAQAAAETDTQVMFITAHDEYAVRAFDAGAIDYVLKPVRAERLAQALKRVQARIGQPQSAGLKNTLAALNSNPPESVAPMQWITASVGNSMRIIGIDQVLCFRAEQKLTQVVTTELSAYIRTPLRELIQQLDANQFWQVHRSIVVRAAAIDRIDLDELGKYRLRLKDSEQWLPVSQAFARQLRVM